MADDIFMLKIQSNLEVFRFACSLCDEWQRYGSHFHDFWSKMANKLTTDQRRLPRVSLSKLEFWVFHFFSVFHFNLKPVGSISLVINPTTHKWLFLPWHGDFLFFRSKPSCLQKASTKYLLNTNVFYYFKFVGQWNYQRVYMHTRIILLPLNTSVNAVS